MFYRSDVNYRVYCVGNKIFANNCIVRADNYQDIDVKIRRLLLPKLVELQIFYHKCFHTRKIIRFISCLNIKKLMIIPENIILKKYVVHFGP